jgi:hypothetical protein
MSLFPIYRMLVMNLTSKNIITLANVLLAVYFVCQEIYTSNR